MRPGRSVAWALADLAQCIVERAPQPPGVVRREMEDQAGTRFAVLLGGEHDSRLGIVVVVTDRHGPRQACGILVSGGQVRLVERLVIDRTSHTALSTALSRQLSSLMHRRRCKTVRRTAYLRMLTALAITSATNDRETIDCSIIVSFAQRASGSVSVGLNAVALVNER